MSSKGPDSITTSPTFRTLTRRLYVDGLVRPTGGTVVVGEPSPPTPAHRRRKSNQGCVCSTFPKCRTKRLTGKKDLQFVLLWLTLTRPRFVRLCPCLLVRSFLFLSLSLFHTACVFSQGKTAMLLDFGSDTIDVDFAVEFKPMRGGGELSKAALEKMDEKRNTLPDDLHYKTIELTRLFTRPDIGVMSRRNRTGDALNVNNVLGSAGT